MLAYAGPTADVRSNVPKPSSSRTSTATMITIASV